MLVGPPALPISLRNLVGIVLARPEVVQLGQQSSPLLPVQEVHLLTTVPSPLLPTPSVLFVIGTLLVPLRQPRILLESMQLTNPVVRLPRRECLGTISRPFV